MHAKRDCQRGSKRINMRTLVRQCGRINLSQPPIYIYIYGHQLRHLKLLYHTVGPSKLVLVFK